MKNRYRKIENAVQFVWHFLVKKNNKQIKEADKNFCKSIANKKSIKYNKNINYQLF